MASARDAHDDWYDDEPCGDAGPERARTPAPRPLALVGRAPLAFELVAPDSFDAAQIIADRLRAGTPVLVDFHGVDRELAGRLTDFCSGLVYAVEGTLQHIGREALLLAPRHLDLSGDAASGIREPGFYNRS
jgi:cell division inhibitor SepF